MKKITVNTSRVYEVFIGGGLLSRAGELLAAAVPVQKALVVSDDIVYPLYGKTLESSLSAAGFSCRNFVFPNGEAHKRLSVIEEILEYLAKEHFCRSDVVVALGGGVCGDMAGFAAAIFCRGIRYIQVPTTLLAAVDSSVGGKTAVDLSCGKNLCGAFHQPALVLCDTDTLSTLAPQNTADGLAEMLKYGVICDADLFEKVKNYKNEDMESLIARCVEIKRDVVAEDEFDRGTRQLLNLGHTVGHAIEAASGFKITHGQGVAAGMAIVARGAEALGLCAPGTAKQIEDALDACGLPQRCDFDADTLAALTLSDKKADGDFINLIIPRRIGKCEIVRTKQDDVRRLIARGL